MSSDNPTAKIKYEDQVWNYPLPKHTVLLTTEELPRLEDVDIHLFSHFEIMDVRNVEVNKQILYTVKYRY